MQLRLHAGASSYLRAVAMFLYAFMSGLEHASVPSGTLKSTLTNRLGVLMPTFVTRRTALGVATAGARFPDCLRK